MPKNIPGRVICSVDDCGRFAHGWGRCSLHYERVRRSGSPNKPRKIGSMLGRKFTDEHRAHLREAHLGYSPTPETRARQSAAKLGKPKSAETRARMSGPRRGTEIAYDTAHWRATRELPLVCEMADETCKGRLDVAFRHDAPADLVKVDARFGRPYYTGNWRDGYRRLCRSHHVRYDKH